VGGAEEWCVGRDEDGKRRFLGVLLSVGLHWICHCVAGREAYFVRIRKLDKSSVQTIYNWKCRFEHFNNVNFFKIEVGIYEKVAII